MLFTPEAFIFGLSQGLVVGPVTLYGIREGLSPNKGFWFQVQVILGAALIDAIYLLLATYGASEFIDVPAVRLFMWSLSAALLLSMGVNSLRERHSHPLSFQHVHRHKLKFFETDFFHGLAINLVNPMAIIFWIMVAGSLYAEYLERVSPSLFAMSIVSGGLLSSLVVAVLTLFIRGYFHQSLLKKLVILGSFVLVGYGIFFGFKAFLELKPFIVAAFLL